MPEKSRCSEMEKFTFKLHQGSIGVEPYSKCPFSNNQCQRIQILGYHISVDAIIRDKIFNTQNNKFFQLKKTYLKKNIRKRKRKPLHNILCCWRLYVAGRGSSVWFYGIENHTVKSTLFLDSITHEPIHIATTYV